MPPGALHKDLTERSIRWLGGRLTKKGMRGDREVYVAPGYVADAAVLGNLQLKYDLEYWDVVKYHCLGCSGVCNFLWIRTGSNADSGALGGFYMERI